MKEQVRRLNKTPGTEVQEGVLGTGVTQTPTMGYVQQKQSKGAKLAKTLGMAVGAGVGIANQIVDTKDKKEASFQALEGNADGVAFGMEVIEQARQLPKEQRPDFIKQQLNSRMESLKGSDISMHYLKSNLNAFSNVTENFYKQTNAEIYADLQAERKTKTYSLVSNFAAAGESHADIMENIMSINDVNRAEAGKIYTDAVTNMIYNKAKTNPMYDWKSDVDNLLKITSSDGAVNYASHPVYGPSINTLENNLISLGKERYAASKELRAKAKIQTEDKVVEMVLSGSPTADVVAYLKQNPTGYKLKEIKDLETEIKTFGGTPYASSSDGDVYNNIANAISDGKYTPAMLLKAKGSLTVEDYKALNNKQIAYKEAIKDEVVSNAKNTFEKRLTAGRQEAGGGSIFTISDDGAKKSNIYVTEMLTQRNAFVAKYGYAALTNEEVTKWHEVAYKMAQDVVSSSGNSLQSIKQNNQNTGSSNANTTNSSNSSTGYLNGIYNNN